MSRIPPSVQNLIDLLNTLPGVGPKTAERFAYHLVSMPAAHREAMSRAIVHVTDDVTRCRTCVGIIDTDPCSICSDTHRDAHLLCVVSESTDVTAIEKTGAFRGRYHVLGGSLSPIEGITAEQLRIKELVERCRATTPKIAEVVIATDPDMDGESTALYLAKELASTGVRLTRIALGLPMGSTVEYADEVTLANALKGRRALS